jgi:hypothetical protein
MRYIRIAGSPAEDAEARAASPTGATSTASPGSTVTTLAPASSPTPLARVAWVPNMAWDGGSPRSPCSTNSPIFRGERARDENRTRIDKQDCKGAATTLTTAAAKRYSTSVASEATIASEVPTSAEY